MTEVTVEDVAFVLQLISEGKVYREITAEYGITKTQIHYRIELACAWFGFTDTSDDRISLLMRAAIGTGFIPGPERREMNVSLSPLESQVLPFLLEGCTTDQVARTLDRDRTSIDHASAKLLKKCNAETRPHLIALWTVFQRPAVQVHPQPIQTPEHIVETELTRQIIQLLSEGNSERRIGKELGISYRVVNYRLQRAYEWFNIPEELGDKHLILVRQAILSGFIVGPPQAQIAVSFTDAEYEVLWYLMMGYSGQQIHEFTGKSERTIRTLVITLYGKLGIESASRAHLVAVATLLIEVPQPEDSEDS